MLHKRRKLLLGISIACNEIIIFTKDETYKSFRRDRKLQLAIEREFEIIGEVLYSLSKFEEEVLSSKIPEYKKIIELGT